MLGLFTVLCLFVICFYSVC